MAPQTYPAPPPASRPTPTAPRAPPTAPRAPNTAPRGSPYGPPPAGLGYPQPPRPKKNTGRIIGGIVGGLVLVAGAVVGALLLFGTKTLDEADLSDLIATATTNAGAEASDISCPGDVEAQKGHTFTCTATVDGQQVTYQVTQTDDEGKVEVKADARFVPVADAENAVSSQVGADAGVGVATSCEADGHTTLVVTGSTDLRCTVTNAGDATDSVDVTAIIDGDGNGNVSVSYDR